MTAFEDLPGRFELTASTEGTYLGPRGPLVALLVEQVFEDDHVDPEGPPRARRPYRAGIATRYLAARRVRALADLVEGDQDLPQRRRRSR